MANNPCRICLYGQQVCLMSQSWIMWLALLKTRWPAEQVSRNARCFVPFAQECVSIAPRPWHPRLCTRHNNSDQSWAFWTCWRVHLYALQVIGNGLHKKMSIWKIFFIIMNIFPVYCTSCCVYSLLLECITACCGKDIIFLLLFTVLGVTLSRPKVQYSLQKPWVKYPIFSTLNWGMW